MGARVTGMRASQGFHESVSQPEGDPRSLAAVGVSKNYGSVVALHDVSLHVAGGECVALVGESGSGKTTLLRCFNRLVEPDQGRIFVGGEAVQELDSIQVRRRIGYVQQDGGLLPHWRVLRNVALVPWLHKQPNAKALAADALRLVGLPAETFGGRWPSELSGGQRQRVALARALAAAPSIILLDEPFGALDAISRSELQEAFGELRQRLGVTTVLVTHDLHEAALLADRIAVLREGRLEQIASAQRIRSEPATDYVRRLVSRAGLGSRDV